jgi:hypothetical protein
VRHARQSAVSVDGWRKPRRISVSANPIAAGKPVTFAEKMGAWKHAKRLIAEAPHRRG